MATPRKLATRELFLAFRRVGEARGWADVEHEAVQCVKKVQTAGFATLHAVAAAAREGTLNAALKAAGRKQFIDEALAMLGQSAATGAEAGAEPDPEPEPAWLGAERDDCPLCLAPLPAAGSSGRVRTPCGHEFCMNCLHRLLRTAYRHSCPMCRTRLQPDFVDSLHEAEDEADNTAWLRDVRKHMRQNGSVRDEAPAEAEDDTAPLVRMRLGNTYDGRAEAAEGGEPVVDERRHRWTLYIRSSDGAFPAADYLASAELEYHAENGSDGAGSVVRTTLRGPVFEWQCETRRPVLVSVRLRWQGWTGLSQSPSELTHLVCLSGAPWDDNDNALVLSHRRRNQSAAPGEQMEQALSVQLRPRAGSVHEPGATPAEERRRTGAVARSSRARLANLARPAPHGAHFLPPQSSLAGFFSSLAPNVCAGPAAARSTMAARRNNRAGGSAPPAAFGRRAAPAARTVSSARQARGDGESAGDAERGSVTAREPRPRPPAQSARAGRRAAAAPLGSPGVTAGVEAAAALRALASSQLRQISAEAGAAGEGGGGDGNDEGPVEAAEERLQEIRERYALRRAVLSLQGDRAARARRVGQRGMGNASARQLVRPEPAQPSRRLRRLRVAAAD